MPVTPLSPVVVCRRALALCALAIVAASPSLAQGNPAATRSAADSAMTRERFCDAAYLYRKLDEQSSDATTALKGAEGLAQGGDRAGAVAVLEAFAVRFPGHPLQGPAAKRLELIKTAIGKVGPGSPCPIPPPDCGNGVVEGQETCDDGNRIDADTCPATCIAAGTVAAVVTPPVVTPPVAPPVVKPPVVTPPVVTPPVVTTPAPTTAPTTTTTQPTTAATTATPTTTTPVADEPPTSERLPEDGQTPVATTIEPVPAVDPPPPPPPEKTDTVEPEASDTDVEEPEVPAGPGPPIAGIAISTVGGLVLVGGGGALVIGVLPAISYFSGRGGQAAAVADYEAAADGFERRQAAGAAADARAAQVRDSTSWNTQGRFLVIGGSVGLAAGVGALIGGIVMIATHGGDETDADEAPASGAAAPDDDDEKDDDDDQKEVE